MKRSGILFCVVGPAASGKTTVVERVMSEPNSGLHRSISTTSRAPRNGETSGKDYYFVSRSEFENLRTQNQFFEWEEIHDNLYGTRKSTVQDAFAAGKDLVLTIDIGGAVNFKKAYPLDVVVVFLLPPSWEVLEQRLTSRGPSLPEEIARRLQTAKAEYSRLIECYNAKFGVDYVIVNDRLEQSCAAFKSIIDAERLKFARIDAESLRKQSQTKNSQG